MQKGKYKFNPETLKYELVNKGFLQKLKKAGLYTLALIFSFVVFYFLVALNFIDTDEEKRLSRENSQLMLQFKTMSTKMEEVKGELDKLKQKDDNIYRVVFGANPLPEEIREAGFGGSERYKNLENLKDGEILIETNKKLDMLQKQINIQKESYTEIINLAVEKEKKLKCIPAIQPISNKDLTRAASGWGMRIHPIYKIPKFHYGMDFTAPTGTDIYSTGDGYVETVRKSNSYGNMVVINHGYNMKTLYAHMNEFNVKQGQKVKRGDIIGFVGNTGLSTAPHLHYEVHMNDKQVNPINYYFNDLTPAQYDKMIEISKNSKQTFD